jgi:hypothetical protein
LREIKGSSGEVWEGAVQDEGLVEEGVFELGDVDLGGAGGFLVEAFLMC